MTEDEEDEEEVEEEAVEELEREAEGEDGCMNPRNRMCDDEEESGVDDNDNGEGDGMGWGFDRKLSERDEDSIMIVMMVPDTSFL